MINSSESRTVSSERKVLRGGALNGEREFVRCACRRYFGDVPSYRNVNLGFRVVKK